MGFACGKGRDENNAYGIFDGQPLLRPKRREAVIVYLMFIGPCIVLLVE